MLHCRPTISGYLRQGNTVLIIGRQNMERRPTRSPWRGGQEAATTRRPLRGRYRLPASSAPDVTIIATASRCACARRACCRYARSVRVSHLARRSCRVAPLVPAHAVAAARRESLWSSAGRRGTGLPESALRNKLTVIMIIIIIIMMIIMLLLIVTVTLIIIMCTGRLRGDSPRGHAADRDAGGGHGEHPRRPGSASAIGLFVGTGEGPQRVVVACGISFGVMQGYREFIEDCWFLLPPSPWPAAQPVSAGTLIMR